MDRYLFTTTDDVSAHFASAAGISQPLPTRGWRSFLREFGQWFATHDHPDERVAVLPPSPSHAATFWTGIDDLIASHSDRQLKPTSSELIARYQSYFPDPEVLLRPTHTLSSGERAILAIAKCELLVESADRAVICDPSRSIFPARRFLVNGLLSAPRLGQIHTIILSLGDDAATPTTAESTRPAPLQFELVLYNPCITYPARHFPITVPAHTIKYDADTATLQLHSPLLITGDNGVGKSSLLRALGHLQDFSNGDAYFRLGSARHSPRLLFHDTSTQVFALEPRSHITWANRLAPRRADRTLELFQDMVKSFSEFAAASGTTADLGNVDHPTGIVASRLALVAERLGGPSQVLALDEPTSGLSDATGLAFLATAIKHAHASKTCVVVASHHDTLPRALFESAIQLRERERRDGWSHVRVEMAPHTRS